MCCIYNTYHFCTCCRSSVLFSIFLFVCSEWKQTWLEWPIIIHTRLHLLRYLLAYVLYTGIKHKNLMSVLLLLFTWCPFYYKVIQHYLMLIIDCILNEFQAYYLTISHCIFCNDQSLQHAFSNWCSTECKLIALSINYWFYIAIW